MRARSRQKAQRQSRSLRKTAALCQGTTSVVPQIRLPSRQKSAADECKPIEPGSPAKQKERDGASFWPSAQSPKSGEWARHAAFADDTMKRGANEAGLAIQTGALAGDPVCGGPRSA